MPSTIWYLSRESPYLKQNLPVFKKILIESKSLLSLIDYSFLQYDQSQRWQTLVSFHGSVAKAVFKQNKLNFSRFLFSRDVESN